jgi:tryptophanyl-tRNA synthetase
MEKGVILSGIQPTGKLHLGNWAGAIKNWVKLQDEYKCFYMIADLHALTAYYSNPKEIKNNVIELYIDLVACGIDLNKSVLFIQSSVPAHSELNLIFGMITPLGWLQRNPTFKEKIKEMKNMDLNNYGFLGYPVLQAADILIYKADKVPVGEDQLAHLEITREIARRFNYLYGEFFPEPQALLTEVPKILGFDGRKMSKSYNNAIYLSDSEDEIKSKVMKYITDTKKIYKNDPGNPENCNLFPLYKAFANKEVKNDINEDCRSGKLGCVECKNKIAKIIIEILKDYKEKRNILLKNKNKLVDYIRDNNEKANSVAKKTIEEVYELIGLKYV